VVEDEKGGTGARAAAPRPPPFRETTLLQSTNTALADFEPAAPVDPASPEYADFVALMASFFEATDTCTLAQLHNAVFARATRPSTKALLRDERAFLAMLKLAADQNKVMENAGIVYKV
jgi:hypothetical protein